MHLPTSTRAPRKRRVTKDFIKRTDNIAQGAIC